MTFWNENETKTKKEEENVQSIEYSRSAQWATTARATANEGLTVICGWAGWGGLMMIGV